MITVAQLIVLLEQHADPNAKVSIEGCDCCGDCIGIEVEDVKTVVLRRDQGNEVILPDGEVLAAVVYDEICDGTDCPREKPNPPHMRGAHSASHSASHPTPDTTYPSPT